MSTGYCAYTFQQGSDSTVTQHNIRQAARHGTPDFFPSFCFPTKKVNGIKLKDEIYLPFLQGREK